MIRTFAPPPGRSGQELSDYLHFCLNCREYHRKKALQTPEGSYIRALHICLFRQFDELAHTTEAVLKLREREQEEKRLREEQALKISRLLEIMMAPSLN